VNKRVKTRLLFMMNPLSMASGTDGILEELNSILSDLKSEVPDTRLQSALDLRRHVRPRANGPCDPLLTLLGYHKSPPTVFKRRRQTMGGCQSKSTLSRA
jgi:hypothetical protein